VKRKESQQQHAEGLIANELNCLRLKEKALMKLPKGETVVPFVWIAKRLSMGSRTYAQNLVHASEGRKA
jgi:hypothetical protein